MQHVAQTKDLVNLKVVIKYRGSRTNEVQFVEVIKQIPICNIAD